MWLACGWFSSSAKNKDKKGQKTRLWREIHQAGKLGRDRKNLPGRQVAPGRALLQFAAVYHRRLKT